MAKRVIKAERNGVVKVFSVVAWAQITKRDGSHDGWTRIMEDAQVKKDAFVPKEISTTPLSAPVKSSECIPCGKK